MYNPNRGRGLRTDHVEREVKNDILGMGQAKNGVFTNGTYLYWTYYVSPPPGMRYDAKIPI